MTTKGRLTANHRSRAPELFEAQVWSVGSVETLTMSAQTFARSPRPIKKDHPEWWMDNRRKHISMSLPIYALRDVRRPGIGKFTDLGRIYRDVLARQGIDTLILLPPFQPTHISPYSPVSVFALNELYIDWAFVPEVCDDRLMKLTCTSEDPRWVHYEDEFDRAEKLRLAAYRAFTKNASAFRRARFREFLDNQQQNRNWLNEYAWFTAEKNSSGSDNFLRTQAAESRMFAQWIAYNQFKDAIDEVHIAGGHLVIDIPLFRACNSVDTSRHSEYFRDGHPGAGGQIWRDQSLWNWDKLRSEGSQYLLAPIEHWLDFGCDGARVDAAANAFKRNGQSGGGDEDGERFIADLAKVFHHRGALPLVEVLCAPDVTDAVERHGMLALFRDWQVYSTHDFINADLSQDAQHFLEDVKHLLRHSGKNRGWKGALFVNITFLDVEGDPYKLKRVAKENGRVVSIWDTQMSLPSDPDFQARSRWDRGFSLACVVSEETGRTLDTQSPDRKTALLPRIDLSNQASPTGGNGETPTSRKDLPGRAHGSLLMSETNAYLTRGNGFNFQGQGHAGSGWIGFRTALATAPDPIIAQHLEAKDIERYVNYIERLVPQAEAIQAWESTTLRDVDTPEELRVWARRFDEQLRMHASIRVEAWRRRQSGEFKETPSSDRLLANPRKIAADSQNPRVSAER